MRTNKDSVVCTWETHPRQVLLLVQLTLVRMKPLDWRQPSGECKPLHRSPGGFQELLVAIAARPGRASGRHRRPEGARQWPGVQLPSEFSPILARQEALACFGCPFHFSFPTFPLLLDLVLFATRTIVSSHTFIAFPFCSCFLFFYSLNFLSLSQEPSNTILLL